jgi:hypothetical protein
MTLSVTRRLLDESANGALLAMNEVNLTEGADSHNSHQPASRDTCSQPLLHMRPSARIVNLVDNRQHVLQFVRAVHQPDTENDW